MVQHMKGASLGQATALLTNKLERLAKDKHSSLLHIIINDCFKTFYNVGPLFLCFETFFFVTDKETK
jgi:hypothetical protein